MRNQLKYLLLVFAISGSFADEAIDRKNNAILKLESEFAMQLHPFSSQQSTNQVNWPAGLDVTIDNQWKFNFKSKEAVTISRISLAIDNTSIANQVNLHLQANVAAHYFFSDVKLHQVVQTLTRGYNFIGVYKLVKANDFIGFSDYKYKKLRVTIDWMDSSNNYNESVTEFMLVMAK